jgi:hypothetical protein
MKEGVRKIQKERERETDRVRYGKTEYWTE